MKTLATTPANVKKLVQVASAWDSVLAESLSKGFHGTVSIELAVQDGTIQHIRRRLERIEK